MARHKSLIKLKLPFFKIKIKKDTFFNILGFLLIGFSVILILSFFLQANILTSINRQLFFRFGFLSIFVPVILLLVASHFFNSKKLKIIRPHITIGLLLIFISFLGVLKTGSFGKAILSNLISDFTLLGASFILLIMFVIGIILFFNTSVDILLLFIIKVCKSGFIFLTNLLFKQTSLKKNTGKVKEKPKEAEFIENINLNKPLSPSVIAQRPIIPPVNQVDDIIIKPYKTNVLEKWQYPPLSLITDVTGDKADIGDDKLNSQIIEKTLDSFGIRAEVVNVNPGPAVTQYEIKIVKGIKLSRITTLSDNLALALAAPTGQIRIEAPIPGKDVIGIEIPNRRPEIVTLKKLLSSPLMVNNHNPLLVPMGLDVSGNSIAVDISRMPHILVAGTTGSGKSILLNAWICSLLYRTTPAQLRLILVDPKRVELILYNNIPHLMTEVIMEPKETIKALDFIVKEMDTRYKLFAKIGVKNLENYNLIKNIEPLPNIVFIIDELADLMMFASNEAETLITRIAQLARATGIHLILATQRPSVDIITGLMKANIPARVAFNVASNIDSRVVLDMPGAEKLLGKGDMLFLPPDQAKPKRIQGPYISEEDVKKIVTYLKEKNPPVHYTQEIKDSNTPSFIKPAVKNRDHDSLFEEALNAIYEKGEASASYLQRRLSIGYARAARILDQLHEAGYIGESKGSKPREIISRGGPNPTEIQG